MTPKFLTTAAFFVEAFLSILPTTDGSVLERNDESETSSYLKGPPHADFLDIPLRPCQIFSLHVFL